MTRRHFLNRTVAVCAATWMMGRDSVGEEAIPHVDLHVHLDNSTIDAALEQARERNVKFGIVEHAGTKENVYPTVLSNDSELAAYVDMLDGKPVYKGVQAEWLDWKGCFSHGVLSRLDYILSDAMTMPNKDGHPMKLWEKGAEIGDAQSFMDRYVDWHVKVLENEPLDVLANVTWLPEAFKADYDTLWTEARMRKVVETAVKQQTAIEISGSMKLPKLPFLQIAKAAGAKFSFGSNGRYPNMGKIEYSLEMAQALGLTAADMFIPSPQGPRAARRNT